MKIDIACNLFKSSKENAKILILIIFLTIFIFFLIFILLIIKNNYLSIELFSKYCLSLSIK